MFQILCRRKNRIEKTARKSFSGGMTILEIIVAILILGGCITALNELVRNAFRNARESKDMVQAELLAESILAKVRLGIIDMEPAFDVPVSNIAARNDEIADTNAVSSGGTGDVLWYYSLEINNIDEYGLVELRVKVRQTSTRNRNRSFVIWFVGLLLNRKKKKRRQAIKQKT